MADNGVSINASQDGAIYDVFAGGQSFIIDQIGEEFLIETSESSLQVTIGAGEAIIRGRHITATADNQITLPASSTIYLCLRIDLTQTAGNEGSLVALTSEEAIQNGNLNAGQNVCDLLLYTVTTSVNGVSGSTDKRDIRAGVSGIPQGGTAGQVLTKTEEGFDWETLPDSDDLYVNVNYSIPSGNYQTNTGGSWAMQFYADVPCEGATTDMTADVIPNSSITSQDDYGLLTYTDILTNGTVRCYFSEQPASTYAIAAFQLTKVTESTDAQTLAETQAVLAYYKDKAEKEEAARQEALALAKKETKKQAQIAAEEQAKFEAEQAAIQAQNELRLSNMETGINLLATTAAPTLMTLASPPAETYLFKSISNEFEAGKEYKKGNTFIYNGIMGYCRSDISAGNVWEPYWTETGENNGKGTEAIFAPRPEKNADGSYNFIYGMRVDVGMVVVYKGTKYKARQADTEATDYPDTVPAIYKVVE